MDPCFLQGHWRVVKGKHLRPVFEIGSPIQCPMMINFKLRAHPAIG